MWNSSQGRRVLTAAESELVRELIDLTVDQVALSLEVDQSHQTGVLLFDNLQATQQLAMLHRVAQALLLPEYPAPQRTAILEATVYALYRELMGLIELEIDAEQVDQDLGTTPPDGSPYDVRSRTLAAYEQAMSADELEALRAAGFLPDLRNGNVNDWEPLVERLADQILWDRDFEMEYLVADEDPQRSQLLKSHLGIDGDYYAAVAADLSLEQIAKITAAVRELVRSG